MSYEIYLLGERVIALSVRFVLNITPYSLINYFG